MDVSDEYITRLAQMRSFYETGATTGITFRKKQLLLLRTALKKYEQDIATAMFKDLHRSSEECYLLDTGMVHAEISFALDNLDNWMHPKENSSPLSLFPSKAKVVRVPHGVCLIIAPWNYPVLLLLSPLVSAIAGGNCAMLKPSENAYHTSLVIQKMISEFFDPGYIGISIGDGAVIVPQLIRSFRFDHIFFTGSMPVGKQIAMQAAEHIIPVTLELGGKSPCIVDKDVDLVTAAKRITWGKFTNAGQTCVAPDYLLVHESKKDELIALMQKNIHSFYGDDAIKTLYYGRIVNEKNFDRLVAFLAQGNIIEGGITNRKKLFISPTIMDNVPLDKPIMQEEIFGPILPVYTYKTDAEAVAFIRNIPDPLSLYVFSNNTNTQKLFTESISFGGGCINNTLVHLGDLDLPFGGVGNSGMGAYHGKYGFETFTRPKAILKTSNWIDPSLKYPPYKGKIRLFRWLMN